MKNLIVLFVLISIFFIGCNTAKTDDLIFNNKNVNNQNASVSRELLSDVDVFYSIDSEFIDSKYYDLFITKLDNQLNVIQQKRTNLDLHYRTTDLINTPNELIIGVLYSPINNMSISECGILVFNKKNFTFSLTKLPNLTNSKFFKIIKNDNGYTGIIKNSNGEMKLLELSNEFTVIVKKELITNFSKFITVNDNRFTFSVLNNELVISILTSDFSNIINSKRIELENDKHLIKDVISNNGYLYIALNDNDSKKIQIVRLSTNLDSINIDKLNASSLAFCNKGLETFLSIILEEDDLKVEIKRVNADFTYETLKSHRLSNYQIINHFNCFSDDFFIGGSVYLNKNYHSIIYTLKWVVFLKFP